MIRIGSNIRCFSRVQVVALVSHELINDIIRHQSVTYTDWSWICRLVTLTYKLYMWKSSYNLWILVDLVTIDWRKRNLTIGGCRVNLSVEFCIFKVTPSQNVDFLSALNSKWFCHSHISCKFEMENLLCCMMICGC